LEYVRKSLTYTNTAIAHDMKRHYNNFWMRSKNLAQWEAVLEDMKKRAKRTLVAEEDGKVWIRPGSVPYLSVTNVENKVSYPIPKKIPWKKPLPFELHSYQEESWQKLLAVRHGNVELCTGAGKSAILLKLCRETGFRTAIIAPSKSIFNELLEKFETHFGKGMVGAFGAGKKKLDKRFTICIGDSVTNIKRETPEWDFFSGLDMLCVDESHTWGAETLENICYGVLADIPYRFFFSGTQTRNDGAEKLLQSIIGRTVHVLTTREAVAGGYICPHDYRIVAIESSNPNYNTQDALDMKRVHFLKNRNICAFVAKLVNAEAMARRRQTLVLVEELEQIAMLLPLIKVPYAIAHSEKKIERLQELGIPKVDPTESVDIFNRGDAMVLIGTSCISTGTNIYPMTNTVNWQGGASEIRTKQGSIGRSVRLYTQNPYYNRCMPKEKVLIWDFAVYDVEIMMRHLEERLTYYRESGSEIREVKLPK
jgi:superfamily II DNA or RNA helicase